MKKAKFRWLTFYEIAVVSARSGEHIKLGTGSDFIMPEMWALSVKRINEDGSVYFAILFNQERPVVFELIAHECWHMLFQILEFQGEGPLCPSELQKEMYAMAFETLVGKVLESLSSMGLLGENKE